MRSEGRATGDLSSFVQRPTTFGLALDDQWRLGLNIRGRNLG